MHFERASCLGTDLPTFGAHRSSANLYPDWASGSNLELSELCSSLNSHATPAEYRG